jgi:rhamnosyltransferase
MSGSVTVAIPTLNAGPAFVETLTAVRAQQVDREVQLLICDSGSGDRTIAVARSFGADVIEIPRRSFSHGSTRNLMMTRARGDHVAFLTQDAVPADQHWLGRLLSGFRLAPRVGLVFGPYRARPGASLSVARELSDWFESFSDHGEPRVDVLQAEHADAPPRHFLGHLGFFTDVNGCVARAAWEQVPFREIAYAEDHLLAQDMLRAGYAKVYLPDAAVLHSHEYSIPDWLRRSFDEARAMREIYGWVPPASPKVVARNLRGNLAADWRWIHRTRAGEAVRPRPGDLPMFGISLVHYVARAVGALLGSRAEHLPQSVVTRLSLERRR